MRVLEKIEWEGGRWGDGAKRRITREAEFTPAGAQTSRDAFAKEERAADGRPPGVL